MQLTLVHALLTPVPAQLTQTSVKPTTQELKSTPHPISYRHFCDQKKGAARSGTQPISATSFSSHFFHRPTAIRDPTAKTMAHVRHFAAASPSLHPSLRHCLSSGATIHTDALRRRGLARQIRAPGAGGLQQEAAGPPGAPQRLPPVDAALPPLPHPSCPCDDTRRSSVTGG